MAKPAKKSKPTRKPPLVAKAKESNGRCVRDVMARPFFSLSKRPRTTALTWSSADGKERLEVIGTTKYGVASIYDCDYLIWACEKVRRRYEDEGIADPTIYFRPNQLFREIGKRNAGKAQYDRARRALKRLHSTTVETNIRVEDQVITKDEQGFHWIDHWRTHEIEGDEEATGMWSMTLSSWLFNAVINGKMILSVEREYYTLTSGLEKQLYLLARRTVGWRKRASKFRMETLYALSGSDAEYKFFANSVRGLERKHKPLVGYATEIHRDDDGEVVHFVPRDRLPVSHPLYVAASNALIIRRATLAHDDSGGDYWDER